MPLPWLLRPCTGRLGTRQAGRTRRKGRAAA